MTTQFKTMNKHILVLAFLLLNTLILMSYALAQTTENLSALSLSQAIEIGVENQPSLKAMESQKKIAEYEVGISQTNFYPKLSANSYIAQANGEMILNGLTMPIDYSHIQEKTSLVQNFNLMVPLFTGGKNIGTYQKSKNDKNAADYDYQSAKLDLILQIKTLYRTALYLRELRIAQQELLKESEERVKNDRIAYDAGKIAYANVLRNETRLAQSKQMLTNTEKDYQTVLVQLRSLMGVDSKTKIELAQETLSKEKIDLTPESSLETALKSMPDLLSSSNKLKSAKSDITVKQSDLYPQVGLSAMNDYAKTSGADKNDTWAVALIVSFPFFGSGETFYKINQARESKKQAEYNYQSELLKTKANVESAWLAIHAAEQNIETAAKSIDQAQEDYRIMKLAYESGKRINVEFLDALTALYQAKSDYTKSVLDYNLSIDQLDRLIGKDASIPIQLQK